MMKVGKMAHKRVLGGVGRHSIGVVSNGFCVFSSHVPTLRKIFHVEILSERLASYPPPDFNGFQRGN